MRHVSKPPSVGPAGGRACTVRCSRFLCRLGPRRLSRHRALRHLQAATVVRDRTLPISTPSYDCRRLHYLLLLLCLFLCLLRRREEVAGGCTFSRCGGKRDLVMAGRTIRARALHPTPGVVARTRGRRPLMYPLLERFWCPPGGGARYSSVVARPRPRPVRPTRRRLALCCASSRLADSFPQFSARSMRLLEVPYLTMPSVY